MKLRTLALAASALSLAAAPAIAQSTFARSLAPIDGESKMESGSGVLLGILAGAAVIGGIIIIADDDDDPVSG